MPYETIVGRTKDDFEKFQSKAVGYIGKHIVGTGEDAHLTTKVLIDLLRPHMILITGKRGTGKCLTGDSLITLDDGSVVPIKELEKYENSVASLDTNLKINTAKKSGFYKRTVNELIELKLRSGKKIRLTAEHPLLTVKGWVPANQLDIGSRIATPRRVNIFGGTSLPEHEIKILAYLLSEGHMGNDFIIFTNEDPVLMNEFRECMKLFDPSLALNQHGKDGFSYRVVKSERKVVVEKINRSNGGTFATGTMARPAKSSIRTWIEKIGLSGKLSADKFIPPEIFTLPKSQLSLFLNRLFSGDGSIYKAKHGGKESWEVSYSSKSEIMIRQVQHLLSRFGIISRLRNKKVFTEDGRLFKSFELVVLGESVITFIDEVGFYGQKSLFSEKVLQDSANIVRNPNIDTIPEEIWEIYKPENWAEIGRQMGLSIPKGMRASINYAPSRVKLQKIAEIEHNESLHALATSDIFWDEIWSVSRQFGTFEVYDIEVPTFHNFVANDIIVHNSYVAGAIAEEILLLPEEFKNNLSVVFIDTMGIFWSMKQPNEQQVNSLTDWGLKPSGFDNVKVYVPSEQLKDFQKAGVPVDGGITISPSDFSSEEWLLALNIKRTDSAGVALEKNVNRLLEDGDAFTINDMITRIRDDSETSEEVKNALQNMLTVADQWGVFGKSGTDIEDIIKPSQVTVLDISRLRSTEAWSVRNLLVSIVSRKIYQRRLIARKEEEVAKITGSVVKEKFPLVWLVIDEAHNFVPSEHETVSSEPLRVIAKQGREPGVSLVVITQMPNRLHQDILSQTDIVISHRLTSRDDLQSLHSVMQTYHSEDLWKYINDLPRWPGATVILDDNLEKIFSVNIRPRYSWHAGGTALIV